MYEEEKLSWEALAHKHGLSMSELIRQAIEHYRRFLERTEGLK